MRRFFHLIVFALVYAITWTVSWLPRPLFYALADLNAFLLCYVFRYRRGTVAKNLRNAFPEKSSREIHRVTWGYYRHLADLFLEEAFLMHASARRIMRRCQFDNLADWDKFYQQGRGVVVACAHYGNWEMLTSAAPQMQHTLLSIYKPINNKWLEKLVNASRERLGSVTVEMRHTLRVVAQYVREGNPAMVGLLSDQSPTSPKQYWGTFLNQDTLVFRGIEDIAKRYNMPVYYSRVTKPKRGYYRVHLELITEEPNATPKDWITEKHLRALERSILEAPQYWLWSHRRWKHKRPSGV